MHASQISKTFLALTGLALAGTLLAGCYRGGAVAPARKAAAADVHATPEKAAAAEEKPDLDRPESEIFSAATRCEHGIAQYTCAECRYELGVVKVPPEVLDNPAFGTAVAGNRPVAGGREMTGEVRLNENRSTYLGPVTPGVVRAIHVDVGDRVHAGQVLFEIEATDLGETRAIHQRAHASADLARATLRREEDLFAKQICPEKDVLEARAALRQAEAEEQASHQRLAALGIAEDDIDANDDHTRVGRRLPIRAPFAGVVLDRSISLGALVTPGEKSFLLSDTSTVWVNATIREQEMAAILEQQRHGAVPAGIAVPAYGSRVFAGHVTAVGGVVDEATRTATARVVVDNPDGLLRPGMFAQVNLALDTGARAIAVPVEAVLSDEGRSFVFVRHDREYFLRRPVTTGRRTGPWIEITAGLAGGETVVTRGAFLFKSDVLRSKMGAGCAD